MRSLGLSRASSALQRRRMFDDVRGFRALAAKHVSVGVPLPPLLVLLLHLITFVTPNDSNILFQPNPLAH